MELKFPHHERAPEKSASWVRFLPSGELEFEFYDFSTYAYDHFGGDVAYLYRITPQDVEWLRLECRATNEQTLLEALVQKFPSALHAGQWLKRHPFFTVTSTFDSQA